jgi:hypothetical protein
MEQSKQAKEIMNLMDLTDQLAEEGVIQVTKAPSSAYSSGPGAPATYTKAQILSMLEYTRSMVKKGAADANMLNKIGIGMQEFVSLKKGDPALDYKEGDMGDDAHNKPYGALSQNKAAKASASAELRGKADGVRKEAPELTDIGKKEQNIGQNKSAKGSKVTYSTDA